MPDPRPIAPETPSAALPPVRGWRERLSHARSLIIYLPLYSLATAGCGAASLTASLFDRSGRWPHRVARFWAHLLLWMGGIRVEVTGRENLILDRPCLLVCNHLSYMDIPVIFANLPLQFRIVARENLFRFPFLGWHLRRNGHLPVDRESAPGSLRSILRAADSVRGGIPVFIFPEGGRSMSGVLKDFLPGAFFLAVRAQVPIVPMALIGTREVLPPHSLHLRPRRVRLAILPPVSTEGVTVKQLDGLAATVRGQIGEALKQGTARD